MLKTKKKIKHHTGGLSPWRRFKELISRKKGKTMTVNPLYTTGNHPPPNQYNVLQRNPLWLPEQGHKYEVQNLPNEYEIENPPKPSPSKYISMPSQESGYVEANDWRSPQVYPINNPYMTMNPVGQSPPVTLRNGPRRTVYTTVHPNTGNVLVENNNGNVFSVPLNHTAPSNKNIQGIQSPLVHNLPRRSTTSSTALNVIKSRVKTVENKAGIPNRRGNVVERVDLGPVNSSLTVYTPSRRRNAFAVPKTPQRKFREERERKNTLFKKPTIKQGGYASRKTM